MNTDIRLSVEFWDHPKTVKLERRLGLQGVKSLQILWLWAAQNRPTGILSSMDEKDIEKISRWEGFPGALTNELVNLHWLDLNLETGEYSIHNWIIHNPHLRAFSYTKRLATKTWKRLKQLIFRRDGFVCQYCGTATKEPHCDHKTPLSRGGDNSWLNLITACARCNLMKGSKTAEEWIQ